MQGQGTVTRSTTFGVAERKAIAWARRRVTTVYLGVTGHWQYDVADNTGTWHACDGVDTYAIAARARSRSIAMITLWRLGLTLDVPQRRPGQTERDYLRSTIDLATRCA